MHEKNLIGWLLEAETPSIRYLVLRYLMGAAESSQEIQVVRKEMKATGPIPAILARQTKGGNWADEHSYYTPKYTSTHWSMLLLTELAADETDIRMSKGAEFMLVETIRELDRKMNSGSFGWTCFYGNLLRYALYCGFSHDERVLAIAAALVRDALQGMWCCPYNDDKPCAWGAARALWGLAGIPVEERTEGVKEAIQKGLNFLLDEHSLVAAEYPLPDGGKIHSIWSRLNFPLFYQADILFVLRLVAELGMLAHEGAKPAIDWLETRQLKNGRWRGANPYKPRTWQEFGGGAETSRWISLHAAIILNGNLKN